MPTAITDVDAERALVHADGLLIGVDEVGRGALAGPVCVGAVLIAPHSIESVPTGLTDSKELSPSARTALVPLIHAWAVAYGVGFAAAAEVDAVGVVAALRRAGERAMSALNAMADGALSNAVNAVALLDGSHNWLSRPAMLELPLDGVRPDPCPDHDSDIASAPRVVTRVKADLTCASVAAASVLAKVARDAHMVELATQHPAYGWEGNKGYASAGQVSGHQR